jgi:DNA-directed RNA polymerase subunit beta'
MVLGSYYLTVTKDGDKGEGKIFASMDEALLAYNAGEVNLHAKIKVRVAKMIDGQKVSKIIDATVGQLIFNEPIPQDLGFVDRSVPENLFKLEVTKIATKKELGRSSTPASGPRHGENRRGSGPDQGAGL